MSLRKRIAAWLDPTPERVSRELMELTVKAGRRCAHDLEHAAADVAFGAFDRIEQSQMWFERARMWHDIFYPANGPKDYRHELHRTVLELESKVQTLRNVLAESKIADPTTDDDIPF